MTPQLKAQLRETRRRLRHEARLAKERTEAVVTANPALMKARRRRRLRRAVAVALFLLLLLFLRCEGPGAPTPAAEPSPPPTAEVKKPVAPPRKPAPKKLQVTSRPVERPDFDTPSRPAAAWLDAFRLQVAARSPRLSRCFIGTERPGALRWTTLLSTETGAVGSHEFEASGGGLDLTKEQRACLEAALSSPSYGLTDAPREGLPQRVSLVLEF